MSSQEVKLAYSVIKRAAMDLLKEEETFTKQGETKAAQRLRKTKEINRSLEANSAYLFLTGQVDGAKEWFDVVQMQFLKGTYDEVRNFLIINKAAFKE